MWQDLCSFLVIVQIGGNAKPKNFKIKNSAGMPQHNIALKVRRKFILKFELILCSRHSDIHHHDKLGIIMPILQMRKMRLREVG